LTQPWKDAIRGQLGAAIDMLENAVRACPDPVWSDESVPVSQRFWYLVFHTLFWLDYYKSPVEKEFTPPAPFTLDEMDPAGIYPDRAYTRAELLAYLAHGRRRVRERLDPLSDAAAAEPCGFERRNITVLELFIYDLRHVQHHVGQLQLLLRQGTDSAPAYVGRGREA